MSASAQDILINQDESKVPPYILPDPLVRADGKRITSSQQWLQYQRSVMLKLFADNVYGRMPGKPKNMWFKVYSIDSNALQGKAIRKQVTIFFNSTASAPSMDLLLYLPRSAKKPVPVFIGLNFYGNQTIHADSGIHLSTRWVMNDEKLGLVNNVATGASRGKDASKWAVEEVINRGYGLATAYYGDLEPDHPDGWKTGVRTTMKRELSINENEWGAIGAWAWGLSRIMDYLETDAAVDAKKVVITGHSRLGKACLWAAANDQRFAIVVSNNSGEGGAALSKRWFGETIEKINTSFPHWFVAAYKQYNKHPELLPVDQHILLALIAPRPLYVASAAEDLWADPKGEFLSAKNAEPVYALFGKRGLGVTEMPAVDQPVGETIRYHIRTGKHDFTLYDWQQYLDFADKQFGKE
ncbi:MAG: acetylxylan esterase [Bacteroidetes bacterium]|nr:MAG: acetylxylan esterase [Bacteroidota bacterium]